MYSILQIEAQPERLEEIGTKRKFWYRADDGQNYLFKAEERGTGEDWAEKAVCEIARALGIPHVEYGLAEFPAIRLRGVICPNMAPPPRSLILGNQLLFMADRGYPKDVRKKFGIRKYTVEAVGDFVSVLSPPEEHLLRRVPPGVKTALGVFVGYMMLDTLVANQDRHHQNWGAILVDRKLRLAPTFDHGSALARNISDAERLDRLATQNPQRTVAYYAERALSEFYPLEGGKTLPVIEVFRQFARKAPGEADAWLESLDLLGTDQMAAILAEIPPTRMTETTKRFTLELLTINKKRLLEGYSP